MKLPKNSESWILAGMTLLFIAIVLVGLYEGELKVPSKGFRATITRESNPVGFYALAAFLSAIAALCGWLLVMVLRARSQSSGGTQPRTPPPRRGIDPRLGIADRIRYLQDGRSGHVVVDLPGGIHSFYWEFGGGRCVAFVSVPTAREWPGIAALAPYPRDDFLRELAHEVRARQCPNASIEVSHNAIAFME